MRIKYDFWDGLRPGENSKHGTEIHGPGEVAEGWFINQIMFLRRLIADVKFNYQVVAKGATRKKQKRKTKRKR